MIRQVLRRLAFIVQLLPGVLLWASFPPMGEVTDGLFALAYLLWIARRKTSGAAFRLWFANGFLFWMLSLSWLPAVIDKNGPPVLVILGWIALAAYCALYFGLFGFLAARAWAWVRGEGNLFPITEWTSYGRRLVAILLIEPLLWGGLEIGRANLFTGFAWNPIGLPLAQAGFGAPAALGGVTLLSCIVILINGTITSIFERMLRPKEYSLSRYLRTLETLFPVLLIFGLYSFSPKPSFTEEKPLAVGVVQQNQPIMGNTDYKPVERLADLTRPFTYLKPDLIILPESAFCYFGKLDGANAERIALSVLESTGARSLLTGGERQESPNKLFNSAALYTAQSPTAFYDKVHLVPFGEYIPGDKLIPWLQQFAPVGSCTPGVLKTLELTREEETIPFGVAICYEDSDASNMRRLVRQGARFIAVITNDGWFSPSIESVQHAWQSTARAIELGVPVVRSANTGISGVIEATGEATWLRDAEGDLLRETPGSMLGRVRLTDALRPTPYVVAGDWPITISFLILITVMGIIKRKHDDEKRRKLSLSLG